MGTAVCNKLGNTGTQLVLPYRGDFYDVQHLKLCGDLGQVYFAPYNLKDEESIRKALKYSNLVINLIGRDWETRNFSFEDIYVEGIQFCYHLELMSLTFLSLQDLRESQELPRNVASKE